MAVFVLCCLLADHTWHDRPHSKNCLSLSLAFCRRCTDPGNCYFCWTGVARCFHGLHGYCRCKTMGLLQSLRIDMRSWNNHRRHLDVDFGKVYSPSQQAPIFGRSSLPWEFVRHRIRVCVCDPSALAGSPCSERDLFFTLCKKKLQRQATGKLKLCILQISITISRFFNSFGGGLHRREAPGSRVAGIVFAPVQNARRSLALPFLDTTHSRSARRAR